LLKGRDGQDGAHVGKTSPSLGVSTTWWWWRIVALLGQKPSAMIPRQRRQKTSLDHRNCIRCRLSSKCRGCSSGRLVFPTKVTRGFNIELSGNQYFGLAFLSFFRILQAKQIVLCPQPHQVVVKHKVWVIIYDDM
jgi:hypothetical protein